ncbi:ORF MSV006 hypothetical protein [Melanoplus sanguinipes entomopoxvirus]|uniref:Uncharacterized protein n=1 Tax=Melanoplus sanguinipes entomopoxvirus TaxID=83191 RepID=Q9YW86_MSEPV|nr:ORF MSV006 hypothetical protein [Melanoplus sanguinipes entomopoxvirus]AAC97608.1 ORF MSV006 hypothetical protein [Melanoplus sanguinipes entomopoxvirus 'O']
MFESLFSDMCNILRLINDSKNVKFLILQEIHFNSINDISNVHSYIFEFLLPDTSNILILINGSKNLKSIISQSLQ